MTAQLVNTAPAMCTRTLWAHTYSLPWVVVQIQVRQTLGTLQMLQLIQRPQLVAAHIKTPRQRKPQYLVRVTDCVLGRYPGHSTHLQHVKLLEHRSTAFIVGIRKRLDPTLPPHHATRARLVTRRGQGQCHEHAHLSDGQATKLTAQGSKGARRQGWYGVTGHTQHTLRTHTMQRVCLA